MNKNLKTVLITIICIAAIQLMIYVNYKNYVNNLPKENITPIQQNNQMQNNQFPFSMIEYNIQLGSMKIPDELTIDKTNLFNIECYIKKENTNFAINYKIQYLGIKKCGLCLMPITDNNSNTNNYSFIEFEPLQIIEFNTITSSIDQLKTIKPFITYSQNTETNKKIFAFMSLDDVSIPY